MQNNIIAKMLTENTGTHFLDSGGDNGRNWQRNKRVNFAKSPAATVDFKYGIEVTLDLYHWLDDRLTLSKSLDRRFRRFCAKHKGSDLATVEAWLERLTDSYGDSPTGIYGDGKPVMVNTYNGECLLSQVLQYTFFTMDHQSYVALSIHGGADVRGGYTRVRIFETGETCMFDNAHATIYCTGDDCEKSWHTGDANHWYDDGACGLGAGTQLEKFDRTSETDGEAWEQGKLHVLADRSGLCPCCGNPLKVAASPGGS